MGENEIRNRIDEVQARQEELRDQAATSQNVEELRSINKELTQLNDELRGLRKDLRECVSRGAQRIESGHILSTYGIRSQQAGVGQMRNVASFQMANQSHAIPKGDDVQILRSGQFLSDLMPNKEGLSLGRYMRGAITGDWTGSEKEQHEFRALTTATGSVMIPQVLSNQVIDLARDKSILFQAGVPMVPMDSNKLTISKLKADPVFGFKAEGQAVIESPMEFEGVELKAKTAYGLISISMEALKSSQNLESVVQMAIAEAMAQTIDRACLFGVEAKNEPKGILTYTEINEQVETAALVDYKPFVKAIGKVRAANGEPTAWALNAVTDEKCNLFQNANADPMKIPEVVQNLQRTISNQLPSNGGTGTNESTSMIFDPNALLIGLQSPIMVEISRESGDAWKKGIVYLRVYAMLDIAVLRPKRICKISGLK